MTPDRDSAGWWAATARGEFVVQQCSDCGVRRFPPRDYCAACRSRTWRWQPVEPEVAVESWIVDHTFAAGTTIVMVRLTDAPDCVMYGRWLHAKEPAPGQLAHPVFSEGPLIDWQ